MFHIWIFLPSLKENSTSQVINVPVFLKDTGFVKRSSINVKRKGVGTNEQTFAENAAESRFL